MDTKQIDTVKTPLVSIITICRNEVDRIEATAASVVEQSGIDFEWIVIDGASTDGTTARLSPYRNRMAYFITEQDSGIYNAMNKGVSQATGDYVVFMNGGDCFARADVLESVAYAIKESKADLIYGDLFLDQVGGALEAYPNVLPPHYMLKNMMPHQATFYRRDLFKRFGCYDESYSIAADYDFFVRLIEVHGIRAFHIAKPLAVFDRSGISNSLESRQLRKKENHCIRKKYFKQYRRSWKCLRQEIRNWVS